MVLHIMRDPVLIAFFDYCEPRLCLHFVTSKYDYYLIVCLNSAV